MNTQANTISYISSERDENKNKIHFNNTAIVTPQKSYFYSTEQPEIFEKVN
jgi:hypothetical protein